MPMEKNVASGIPAQESLQEARLFEKTSRQAVICNLCAHRCYVPAGRVGICKVRENHGGTLYTRVYDRVIAQNVDPIEKKPLFHFLPGSRSYSVATVGCNFHCRFCQNWQISQLSRESREIAGEETTPYDMVQLALLSRCETIAYTYTEPTIFFELAYDTAQLAVRHGLRNIFVSNGYMTAEALKSIGPYLHAANIDLKGLDDRRYRRVCGARLQPVLDSIRLMKESGIWLEVTTLVIPGHNDSSEELRDIALFLKNLGAEIPWHLSAFFPAYRMLETPPTPRDTLLRAWRIGREVGLRYVYCGNLHDRTHEETNCYQCGDTVIRRSGFHVEYNGLDRGRCPSCHTAVNGVWSKDFETRKNRASFNAPKENRHDRNRFRSVRK